MKFVLELPDWVDERHIRVFAGIELAAIKLAHEDFFRVKDGRCQMCGKCCTNLRGHTMPTINGECVHLEQPDKFGRRMCKIAIRRPFPCGNDPKQCDHITYKVVKCK